MYTVKAAHMQSSKVCCAEDTAGPGWYEKLPMVDGSFHQFYLFQAKTWGTVTFLKVIYGLYKPYTIPPNCVS